MYGPSINVLYIFLITVGVTLLITLNISCLLTIPRKCGSGLTQTQIDFIHNTNATRVRDLEFLAIAHEATVEDLTNNKKQLAACYAIQNMTSIEISQLKDRLHDTHACPPPPPYSQKLVQSIRDQTIAQATRADWFGHESDYLHQLMQQDHYRHNSIMSSIRPILTAYTASAWITVADSIWGMNAGYIKKFVHAHGGTVTATALTNVTISHAAKANLIDAWSVEDAEQLSFRDHEFDFGLVKDGLQAMSRPAIAIYELLRVSKLGVVLIEPHDAPSPPPTAPPTLGPWAAAVEIPVDPLANLTAAIMLNRYDLPTNPADNVYKLSARECVKIARSMNLPVVMLKGLMDPDGTKTKEDYERRKAVDHAIVDNNADPQQRWYQKMVCVFFKVEPEKAMMDEMRRESFLVITLEQKSFV